MERQDEAAVERQDEAAVERQDEAAVERQEHAGRHGGRQGLADRGQSLPGAAIALWLMVGVVLLAAALGARAVDRARAQSAADAVALGTAAGGDASPIAAANGVVVGALDEGAVVDVVVEAGDAAGAARAQVPRPGWQGLDPRLQAALGAAERLLGRPIPIVSGLRSRADQERLWANRDTNPYPVAPPGTSMHERGLAVDVPLSAATELAAIGPALGLCRPLPVTDPVHFVLCG